MFFRLSLYLYAACLFACVRAARTIVTCVPENCNITSLPRTGNGRILGNRVSFGFSGTVDLSSNREGTTLSADIQVLAGEAWPRISEGVAIPDSNTPGYPVRLVDYFKFDSLFIKYSAQWRKRSSPIHNIGLPAKAPNATGTFVNGAFMYLNHPDNYEPASKAPMWPFTAEVNIWNRYDGFETGHPLICNYTNGGTVYNVYSGKEKRVGKEIRIYYVLKQPADTTNNADMNLDNVKLLKHLVRRCKLSENLDLLEISVIVKAVGSGSEGNFYAQIESMGRAPDLDTLAAANTNNNNTKNGNGSGAGENNDNGAKWEIIGSVIGAIATLIAAILTVYMSQGRCRRRRKQESNNVQLDHLYEERPANMQDEPRFEYI